MSFDNDRSFQAAQRAYDNMLPPEDNSIDCPDCEGSGEVDLSNCCGVEFNTDIMMCSGCHEHCDRCKCDTCGGTGRVILPTKKQLKEEYLADQEKDTND